MSGKRTPSGTSKSTGFGVFGFQKAVREAPLSAKAKSAAMMLSTYADDKSGLAWPSVATLVKSTSLSRATVQWALAELRKEGFLVSQARGNKMGGRGTNLQHLAIPPDQVDNKEDAPF